MFEVGYTEEIRGAGPRRPGALTTLAGGELVRRHESAKPRGESRRHRFCRFVRSGKRGLRYHLSLGLSNGWTGITKKMSGGNCGQITAPHSARTISRSISKDRPSHFARAVKSPIMAQQERDELLCEPSGGSRGIRPPDRQCLDDHALYNGKAKQTTPGPGIQSNPYYWGQRIRQGRVLVDTLGPDGAEYRDGCQRTLHPRRGNGATGR